MGTRSLLGYELPNGKIYAQYLQFDGYPEVQGKNYYLNVIRGLKDLNIVRNSKMTPPKGVFKRIKCYLNEAQYQSGHSVNNNLKTSRTEWFGQKIDSWQEWQYLFTQNGDFIFFHVDKNCAQIVIPWKLSVQILQDHALLDGLEKNDTWWKTVGSNAYAENKEVLSWGKDAPLHINEELEYDSSKTILEKLLKGQPTSICEPVLKLDYGFLPVPGRPGLYGYNYSSYMTIGTTHNSVKVKSMFTSEKRIGQSQTIEALYLHGNKRIKE